MLDGEVLAGVRVRLPLSTVNRHGLVAGATGTGKTKTLQVIAGQLSDAGVPVFVADVKGDLSGLAQPIDAADPKVAERAASLGWTVEPRSHPVELLSLTGEGGAPVRATVESFGPVLLAKVLDLNETQTAVLSLVFRFCDDRDLPLLQLSDTGVPVFVADVKGDLSGLAQPIDAADPRRSPNARRPSAGRSDHARTGSNCSRG